MIRMKYFFRRSNHREDPKRPSCNLSQPHAHAAAESVLSHFLQVSQRFPISVHYFFFPSFDSTDQSKPVQVTLVRFIKAYLVLAKDLKDGE